MNSVVRPRGRLPKRVYWTRRALVLGVLALLVFGVTRLVGGSGGSGGTGPGTEAAAALVDSASSGPTPSAMPAALATPSATPPATGKRHHQQRRQTPSPEPLAEPTGPCPDGDVVVAPAVQRAYAGRDVTITLDLTTKTSLACTWEVSPQTVVVELTSGSDRIWSSQDCPSVIGQQSVVVRRDHETKVSFDWTGRRSDMECSGNTLWAQPGWYHVEAAAFGADPSDQQFHLLPPPRPTITKAPKPSKHQHKQKGSAASPAATPSATPTH